MKPSTIVLSTLLASVLASVAAGTARAEFRGEAVHERSVSFADLDIEHEAGAKALYRRITVAAAEVCETRGVASITLGARARRCAHDATARAVADIDAPVLTRCHATRCR